MNEQEIKMYILVRSDLSRSQQAVQAVHAGTAYTLKYPDTQWDNGTVVLLKGYNESYLKEKIAELQRRGVKYAEFVEPDIGDQLTAVACAHTGEIFRDEKLL